MKTISWLFGCGNRKVLEETDENKTLSRKAFKKFIRKSPNLWAKLPCSVNGNILDFLIFEMNSDKFSVLSFFQHLFDVGLSVYFTFFIQSLLIYTLWLNTPPFEDSNEICNFENVTSINLVFSASSEQTLFRMVQHAVISTFIFLLIPTCWDITREIQFCLFSKRVAVSLKKNKLLATKTTCCVHRALREDDVLEEEEY